MEASTSGEGKVACVTARYLATSLGCRVAVRPKQGRYAIEPDKRFDTTPLNLRYHIDEDERLVTVQASDRVAADELEHLVSRILLDPAFVADYSQLLDFREARIDRLTEDGATLAGYFLRTVNPAISGSVAVVIDPHLTPADTAMMFRLTCAIAGAELFEDFEMAVKWLARKWGTRHGQLN